MLVTLVTPLLGVIALVAGLLEGELVLVVAGLALLVIGVGDLLEALR